MPSPCNNVLHTTAVHAPYHQDDDEDEDLSDNAVVKMCKRVRVVPLCFSLGTATADHRLREQMEAAPE